MEDYIAFFYNNFQPNGQSADSHGPTLYFSSKFTTIKMPKKNVLMMHVYSDQLLENSIKCREN